MTEIAVTGATGAVGGAVARRLIEAGERLRVVVRDPARAPTGDQIEVAVAAYDQPDALRAAFDGISTLFFVSGSEAKNRLDQHRNVVDACERSGVQRIVYTSFLRAAADATFTFARDHFHTEQAVIEAGLGYTFLRDSLYLDVLPYLPGDDGVIRGPAGDGRFAPVARDDVAAVAAAVLLDGEPHLSRTYDLTGPALVNLHEIAGALSDITGRAISYEPETLDAAYASRAHYGAPDWEVRGWVTSYTAIASGELGVRSDVVRTVTGRDPIAPLDWLEAHPASYQHLVEGPPG